LAFGAAAKVRLECRLLAILARLQAKHGHADFRRNTGILPVFALAFGAAAKVRLECRLLAPPGEQCRR
jgi:hypothetical protein